MASSTSLLTGRNRKLGEDGSGVFVCNPTVEVLRVKTYRSLRLQTLHRLGSIWYTRRIVFTRV